MCVCVRVRIHLSALPIWQRVGRLGVRANHLAGVLQKSGRQSGGGGGVALPIVKVPARFFLFKSKNITVGLALTFRDRNNTHFGSLRRLRNRRSTLRHVGKRGNVRPVTTALQ